MQKSYNKLAPDLIYRMIENTNDSLAIWSKLFLSLAKVYGTGMTLCPGEVSNRGIFQRFFGGKKKLLWRNL